MLNNKKFSPDEFLSDLYLRFNECYHSDENSITTEFFLDNPFADFYKDQYLPILPEDKNARILDIGIGDGWFCSMLKKNDYKNIYMADFACQEKFGSITKDITEIKGIYDIKTNLLDFTYDHGQEYSNRYDFIHLAHVIEHIPKYQLTHLLDNINCLLKENGTLLIRTPNLLGPLPTYYLYCTPGHEYGFIEDNLSALLDISNFKEIRYLKPIISNKSIKAMIGNFLRSIYIAKSRFKFRLFEGRSINNFHPELVVAAKK